MQQSNWPPCSATSAPLRRSGPLRVWTAFALAASVLACGRYQYEDRNDFRALNPDEVLASDSSLNSSLAKDASVSVPNMVTNDAGTSTLLPSGQSDAGTAGTADAATACEVGTFDNCSACGDSCAAYSLPGASDFACVSGQCEMVSCTPPYEDCDGDRTNGCEVNLSSLSNCGGCGLSCGYLNASAACNLGACEFVACGAGFGNCDADLAGNGCERPLNSLTDCGGCGVSCTRANGTATCDSGTCALSQCNNGFDNCDFDNATGCETPLDTVANCQSCGTICDILTASESSCSGGACTAATCAAGQADCNFDGLSCETNLSTLTDCVSCGVSCGDANGRLNNSTATCTSGSCQVDVCDVPFANCDSVPGNGCETTLTTLGDCGACNTGCGLDNAGESCATGTCLITSCDSGFENCDGDQSTGCEAQLGTNTHCGGCNLACSAVEVCENAQCVGSFTSFTPSNVDLPSLNPRSAPDLNLNCGGIVTLDTSGAGSNNGWCGGPAPTLIIQEQSNGPDLLVVAVQSLDVGAGTTLRVTGSRPVAFVVFGNAAIDGTIDVSANGTTGGPGQNWQCNLSDAVNAPGGGSSTGGGGGGGGALGANGGPGGSGGGNTLGGAAGQARSSSVLTPLLPGCRGGWGGGCGTLPGAGGGGFQLSVTGSLLVGGSIRSDGGAGLGGCGLSGGATGGGSGGAIVLEANVLSLTGNLSAAGGNGGNGQTGGNGGLGSATGAGAAGTSSSRGGGGGGGSAGRIRIVGAQSCILSGIAQPTPSTGTGC